MALVMEYNIEWNKTPYALSFSLPFHVLFSLTGLILNT
jgi:hypothetical protein